MFEDAIQEFINKKVKLTIEGRKNRIIGIIEREDTDLDMLRGEIKVIIVNQKNKKLSVPFSKIKMIETINEKFAVM